MTFLITIASWLYDYKFKSPFLRDIRGGYISMNQLCQEAVIKLNAFNVKEASKK